MKTLAGWAAQGLLSLMLLVGVLAIGVGLAGAGAVWVIGVTATVPARLWRAAKWATS